MTRPFTIQPGPAQRPTETPIAAPVPPSAVTAPVLPPEVVQASLRASIKDASAWSIMQGAGTNYLTPFLILGGKQLLPLALFAALPALVGGVVQCISANVTDVVGRRNRIIIPTAFAQAMIWLPICVAIFLPIGVGYWLLLACFVGFVGLANFGTPAWQSLMGDLVPPERRGRYFGLRNALSGGVLVAAFWLGGLWLNWCQRAPVLAAWGGRDAGFLVLFALAGVARLVSTWYLTKVHEPAYQHVPGDRFSLLDFLRRAPRAHFGRFVFYCAAMNAGFGFTGPFLPWYFLNQRGYSPGMYATLVAASLLAGVLSQPLWGRLNDRFGSKWVMAVGGLGTTLWPLLMLTCERPRHFAAVMAYDGIVTAAFTIGIGNYLYDVVTPPKRVRCAAYNTLFVAVGSAAGALLGAALGLLTKLLLRVVGLTVGHPFTLLLLVSAAVRLLANFLLLGTFAEFRLRRPAFEPEPG